MCISKSGFLEWITAEEAEKQAKNDLRTYYKQMLPNVVLGVITLVYGLFINKWMLILSFLWLIMPVVVWYISKDIPEEKEVLGNEDKEYVMNLAEETWKYFKDYLKDENNFLIPADPSFVTPYFPSAFPRFPVFLLFCFLLFL